VTRRLFRLRRVCKNDSRVARSIKSQMGEGDAESTEVELVSTYKLSESRFAQLPQLTSSNVTLCSPMSNWTNRCSTFPEPLRKVSERIFRSAIPA
jgi:hypothetical protein